MITDTLDEMLAKLTPEEQEQARRDIAEWKATAAESVAVACHPDQAEYTRKMFEWGGISQIDCRVIIDARIPSDAAYFVKSREALKELYRQLGIGAVVSGELSSDAAETLRRWFGTPAVTGEGGS